MMIKCVHCGHENQLGSIFCRGCGEKLNIDDFRPEVRGREKFNIIKLLKRLVGLAVVVAIVGVIVGLLSAVGCEDFEALEDEDAQKTDAHYEMMMKAVDGGYGEGFNRRYTFSPREATYLFNENMLVNDDGQSAWDINRLVVNVDELDRLRLVLGTTLFGQVPAEFALIGEPRLDETSGEMALDISSAKMGKIDMPASLRNLVTERFKTLLADENAGKLAAALEAISVSDDGDLTFVIKEHRPTGNNDAADKK